MSGFPGRAELLPDTGAPRPCLLLYTSSFITVLPISPFPPRWSGQPSVGCDQPVSPRPCGDRERASGIGARGLGTNDALRECLSQHVAPSDAAGQLALMVAGSPLHDAGLPSAQAPCPGGGHDPLAGYKVAGGGQSIPLVGADPAPLTPCLQGPAGARVEHAWPCHHHGGHSTAMGDVASTRCRGNSWNSSHVWRGGVEGAALGGEGLWPRTVGRWVVERLGAETPLLASRRSTPTPRLPAGPTATARSTSTTATNASTAASRSVSAWG